MRIRASPAGNNRTKVWKQPTLVMTQVGADTGHALVGHLDDRFLGKEDVGGSFRKEANGSGVAAVLA